MRDDSVYKKLWEDRGLFKRYRKTRSDKKSSQLPVATKPKHKKKRISKNTAYRRGRAFEYRVRNYYQKLGYYVIRSYASKGPQDLTCIKKIISCHDCVTSEVLLVQCKNLKAEKPLSKLEKDNLKALAKWTGGKPIHVHNVNHKLVIEELN